MQTMRDAKKTYKASGALRVPVSLVDARDLPGKDGVSTMRELVSSYLRDTRGASIMLALMAVAIATVAAAIVLASASAASSSATSAYTTERAYLSVDSAMRVIEDAISGDSFKKQWLEQGERQGGVFTGGNKGYVFTKIEGAEGYVYIDNGSPNPFRTEISDLVYQQMISGGDRTQTKTVVIIPHVQQGTDNTELLDPVLITFSMTNSTGTASYGYSIKAEFKSAEYTTGSNGEWDVVETDDYSSILLMKIKSGTNKPSQSDSYVSPELLEKWEQSGLWGDICLGVHKIVQAVDEWLNGSPNHVVRLYTDEVSWDTSEFVFQKVGR